MKKSSVEFLEVLGPKVTGLVNLDRASQDLKLDFFICFSSAAGGLGSAGQADYATANAFMDAYARYRNELVAAKKRQGRTLSINWMMWGEGGMKVAPEIEKMWQKSGIMAIETGDGLQAFYRCLGSGKGQMMVWAGQIKQLRDMLLARQGAPEKVDQKVSRKGRRPEMKGLSLEQCLEWDLKQLISKLMRLSHDKLDKDQNLYEFGFNSISFTQLAIQLIKHFGIKITPAMFYGYSSIGKLSQYYLSEHREAIGRILPGGWSRVEGGGKRGRGGDKAETAGPQIFHGQ